MSRAGPECLSPGRAPGGHSHWPHGIMAAAILGQVGTWPTGARGPGEPDGGLTSGWITAVRPFRLGVIPLCLEFRCPNRGGWAPWKGVRGFNGRYNG